MLLQTCLLALTALLTTIAGTQEAAPVIEEILNRWDIGADPYGTATLLDALKKLTVNLPDNIRSKIEAEASEPLPTLLLKPWGG